MSDPNLTVNSSQEEPGNVSQLSSHPVQSLPPNDTSTIHCSSTSDVLVLHSSGQGTPPTIMVYPTPLAKSEEVITNRSLFLETLNKFHATLGTKFMVPTIGGRELDLHLLYMEVTSRGGLQQVIKDRKWKEITGVFNFPPTATNASFILRKYYISLLHHYEQVYFFGACGHPISPPPTALPSPNPVPTSLVSANPPSDVVPAIHRSTKRKVSSYVYGADPTSSVGHPVTGVIDGKFEHGYLVTVVVGSEKLRGVLYQVPPGLSGHQFAEVPGHLSNLNTGDAALGKRPRRRRRRKDEIKKRDPDHPKPNRSGYNFFFAEQHTRLKALHPGKDREISKMIGDSWNNLSEEAKSVYQELGLKDKERYKSEMQEYKQRQQLHCEDTGILIGSNENTNEQLENQPSLQSQHLAASIVTNGAKENENPSNLLENHPEHQLSSHMETERDGFKLLELAQKSDNINTSISEKLESLVDNVVTTDKKQSVDTIMSTNQDCIEDSEYK